MRVFNCSLLSSCHHQLVGNSSYPVVTNSGTRFCLPDPFKRRKCLPGCRGHAPYCHGRCVYGGRACLFHPCSRSPYREDSGSSCSQLAMESQEGECRGFCADLTTAAGASECQSCLVGSIPPQCQHMSGSSCWYCSGSVAQKWEECSNSHHDPIHATLACINQAQPPECSECVCTLLCYWAPAGDLCTACLEHQELAVLFKHHDKCLQGWVWSEATSSCYRAFTQLKPWDFASRFCQNGGGILAEPKANSSIQTILETVSMWGAIGEFWIGGKASGDTFHWDSDHSMLSNDNWEAGFPLTGKLTIAIVIITLTTILIKLGSAASASCIYQTAPDGYFHNAACPEFRYYVCEVDQNTVFSVPAEGLHLYK